MPSTELQASAAKRLESHQPTLAAAGTAPGEQPRSVVVVLALTLDTLYPSS